MENLKEIQEVVEIGHKIREIGTKYGQLNWTYYTTGFDFGIKEIHDQYMKIYEDKKNYELIKKYQNKDLSPDNKRRVDIIEKDFRPYHLSENLVKIDREIHELRTKLSGVLNTHRYKLDGTSNT